MSAVEFLRGLLYFETQVRLYHWSTKLYPRHVASGDLYSQIDGFLDKFVEIYQGKFNGGHLKGEPFKYNNISLEFTKMDDNTIVDLLNDLKKFLSVDLYSWLSNMPNHTNTDLKNLVDELMGNVNKTLYLFTLK